MINILLFYLMSEMRYTHIERDWRILSKEKRRGIYGMGRSKSKRSSRASAPRVARKQCCFELNHERIDLYNALLNSKPNWSNSAYGRWINWSIHFKNAIFTHMNINNKLPECVSPANAEWYSLYCRAWKILYPGPVSLTMQSLHSTTFFDRGIYPDIDPNFVIDNSIVYLMGDAGTGKSTIVNTMREYVFSHCVNAAASTKYCSDKYLMNQLS